MADGPFPKGIYADAPGVKPLEYNPALAMMLVAAARKELGGSPIELKLEYPAIPEAQAVVPRIAEAFRLAGLRIETIERPESELEAELASRTAVRPGLPRACAATSRSWTRAPALPGVRRAARDRRPGVGRQPRILQLLLQLERAAEVSTARGLAIQIDREARDELPVLPLWQVVDHYAWRTRLKGPAETADRLYQGIETWEIQPWIARDPWTKPLSRLTIPAGGARPSRSSASALPWLAIALSLASCGARPTRPRRRRPIDRQPYRIELHLALDPSARIDAARRAVLLKEWQSLVHRFVGPPWIVSARQSAQPPGQRRPRSRWRATIFARFDPAFDKIWLVRISAGERRGGLVFTGREYDAATRRLGPLQVHKALVLADAPRALLQFALELFSPTA